MKVCYLVNQYPKVSHTFVRREILALEALGLDIVRVSVRSTNEPIVDEDDLQEREKTHFLVDGNMTGLLAKTVGRAFLSPLLFFRTLARALSMGRVSNSAIKHCAYFMEACYLVSFCKSRGVSHIHAHFGTNSTTVATFVSLLGGPGYSFTVHGPEEFDIPRQIFLSEKIRLSRFVVAITSFCKSQLFRWTDYSSWSKIYEVHCAVDETMLQNTVDLADDNFSIVTIGRMCEQKGQSLLLEALGLLKSKYNLTPKLHFVGDGELRNELESLAKRLTIFDQVIWYGWQASNKVRSIIDSSSVLLLPSFAEGLPVVIMESLARKRPVISTCIAGIPELVDQECGWVVTAGDSEALCEALAQACSSSLETLSNMGQCGHLRVIERHSAEYEAHKLKELFGRFL